MVILFYSWEVLVSFKDDSILHVFLNPVVFDYGVGSEPIFSKNMYTTGIASPDFVHNNIRVWADGLNADFALDELR